jgi:hypothetical protein
MPALIHHPMSHVHPSMHPSTTHFPLNSGGGALPFIPPSIPRQWAPCCFAHSHYDNRKEENNSKTGKERRKKVGCKKKNPHYFQKENKKPVLVSMSVCLPGDIHISCSLLCSGLPLQMKRGFQPSELS